MYLFYQSNTILLSTSLPKTLRSSCAHDGCHQRTQGPSESNRIELVSCFMYCLLKICIVFCQNCFCVQQKIIRDHALNFLMTKKFDAVKRLQQKLISPPVLAILYAKQWMKLETDGWEAQVECVFYQGKIDKYTTPIDIGPAHAPPMNASRR